jgi:hypothetical protein
LICKSFDVEEYTLSEYLETTPAPKGGLSTTVWIAIGAGVLICLCGAGVVVAAAGGLAWFGFAGREIEVGPPPIAESITIDPNTATEIASGDPAPTLEVTDFALQEPLHVEIGQSHTPYNSDPPTSGEHYPVWADPGFYGEQDQIADEYLVHNLEHGYVILWYDCDQLSSSECDALTSDIQSIISEYDGYKLIGMPRSGMDHPLILTSWGHMAVFDAFQADLIREYIDTYQNDAPEPSAP